MNVDALRRRGFGVAIAVAAATTGLVLGSAPASAALVSTSVGCSNAMDGCGQIDVWVGATTAAPVTIVVNGVTLGGSPFALTAWPAGSPAPYGVRVTVLGAYGALHVVATQKNADGTTSQQTADEPGFSNGGNGTGSSGLSSLYTILDGFQTGSTGGRVDP